MQHPKVAPHCAGPLRATVMILLLKGLVLGFGWGNRKRPAKCHLLENTEILECPPNKLDTIGEGRKHLTVFEGVVASCHLYSSC